MKTLLFLMIAVAGLLLACQPAATETTKTDVGAVRKQIDSLEQAYAKASNEKNVDAILDFYSDDAQTLPAGKPIVKGKGDIRKHLQEEMAGDTSGATIAYEVLDVYADGNLAVEVGKSIRTKKDGSKQTGKYIAVYENRNGKWVCIRDIWNSDTDDDDDDDDDANEGGEDDAED